MKTKLTFFCLIFFSTNFFSQTQVYKSDFYYHNFKGDDINSSITMAGNTIVFNTSNFNLKALDKTNYKTIWEVYVGIRSNASGYFYKDTFLHAVHENQQTRMAQYDLKTGSKIKQFPFESIAAKPHFSGSIMYFTGLMDGGKFLAYDLDKNQIVWEKFIGHGESAQPVYLPNKIIASVDESLWTEMDYNGNLLPMKYQESITIDTTKYNVNKYEFLTHDGRKITKEFLRDNKLTFRDYITEVTAKNTFILSETHLSVLGNNRKIILHLDMETILPPELYENDALASIVKTDAETVWLVYQNHLIHYDFKINKLLRNVYLENWRPHQLILDKRIIWLISKNDGQLYALDFEPDEVIARKNDRDKAIQDQQRCDFPDRKKIEAARAAEEKLKSNN